MAYTKIQEQKRHVNKPDQYYWCDLLHREKGYLVAKYDVTEVGHIGPVEIPVGSLTIAHYRENRGHVLWEMYDPKRKLIGYCYHLCLPPKIGADHVEYLDLLVDLWFDPEGTLTILDEDEYEQARKEGKISKVEEDLVNCEGKHIAVNHQEILGSLWRPPEGLKKL